jgi:hypothetical protein
LIRRLLFFSLPLTMLFTGAIIVIQSRPYDDHALRTFLIPDNCPSPCWQGIRPGRMGIENALTILRSHAWMQNIDTSLYDGFRGWITWEWNGHEPDWIIPSQQDSLWIDQNLVVNVNLLTSIRFGDIWLALGKPDWSNVYYARGSPIMRVFHGYEHGTLIVMVNVECNAGMEGLWFATTSIRWPIFLPETGEIAHGSPKILSTCA